MEGNVSGEGRGERAALHCTALCITHRIASQVLRHWIFRQMRDFVGTLDWTGLAHPNAPRLPHSPESGFSFVPSGTRHCDEAMVYRCTRVSCHVCRRRNVALRSAPLLSSPLLRQSKTILLRSVPTVPVSLPPPSSLSSPACATQEWPAVDVDKFCVLPPYGVVGYSGTLGVDTWGPHIPFVSLFCWLVRVCVDSQ